MFSFLNRNKTQNAAPNNNNNKKTGDGSSELILDLDDAKKNLYESVVLRRTDIVVSLMNEWFKGNFTLC